MMNDIYLIDDFIDAVETIRTVMLKLNDHPHYQRTASYALESLDIVVNFLATNDRNA